MFIRSSRSQGRTYLRLVEGYRDAQGRTRQRQIQTSAATFRIISRELAATLNPAL